MKHDPYWWEDLQDHGGETLPDVPRRTDVAIVGSGVTGLHAALHAARQGREVTVLDAGRLGCGASTRNNGMVVPYLRKSPTELKQALGADAGRQVSRSAIEAFAFLVRFIAEEGLDCGLERNERYLVADTPQQHAHLCELVHEFEAEEIPTGFAPLSRNELEERTGLRGFDGGLLTQDLYALHPGRYVDGLIRLGRNAGVTFLPHTAVLALSKVEEGIVVHTARGDLHARSVAVATNGYSSALLPWLQRRLIPVPAFMAATAPLDPAMAARLFPAPRSFTTCERNPTWIRSSPDRTRILFGARTGYSDGSLAAKAERMRADAGRVLPELRDIEISHCWQGTMAFTFDGLPHLGDVDGIHYAAGFCGVGLTMGSWLGQRLGMLLAGHAIAKTPFQEDFPARFFYRGWPWFLPLMIRHMNIRDRLDRLGRRS